MGEILVLVLSQHKGRSKFLLNLSCRDMRKAMDWKGRTELTSALSQSLGLWCGRMDLSGEEKLSFMEFGNTNCQTGLPGSLMNDGET